METVMKKSDFIYLNTIVKRALHENYVTKWQDKYSRRDISKKIGLTYPAVSYMLDEKNTVKLSIANIEAYCYAVGENPQVIFAGILNLLIKDSEK